MAVILAVKAAVLGIATEGLSRPDVVLLTTAGLVVTLLGWSMLLRLHARLGVLLAADAVLTFVLVADSTFHRYYGSIIPLPVLEQADQLAGVAPSVAALLSPWDLLYTVDLVVLAALWLRLHRRRPHGGGPGRAWSRRTTALATVLAAAVVAVQVVRVQAVSPDAFEDRYGSSALVRAVGPLGYHAADVAGAVVGDDREGVATERVVTQTRLREARAGDALSGVAAGANVIVVQMEAFQGFLVGREVAGQEVTPTLNRLARGEALYWPDYFAQIGPGNTADAEFVTLNGLYPLPAAAVYTTEHVAAQTSLPELLTRHGYAAAEAFHAYQRDFWNRPAAYEAQGFDRYHSEEGFTRDELVGLGPSDASFYRGVVTRLEQLPTPFLAHLVTLSGHHPYRLPEPLRPLDIPDGTFGPVFTDYLQTQAYADRALGNLLTGLDEAGLLDRSVVVVYGDHWGTGWENADLERFVGTAGTEDRFSQLSLRRVPLAIRLPDGDHGGARTETGGMVDLYPTLLNLLGLPRDEVFTLGHDLLNADVGPRGFRYYEPEGTFVDDELAFLASEDGVFEEGQCLHRRTEQTVPVARCRPGYDAVRADLELSDRLLTDANALQQLNDALARD